MVELQREGLKFDPNLMLIPDADQPAIWYHRVKKAWAESVENGTAFVNPVQGRVLRWAARGDRATACAAPLPPPHTLPPPATPRAPTWQSGVSEQSRPT